MISRSHLEKYNKILFGAIKFYRPQILFVLLLFGISALLGFNDTFSKSDFFKKVTKALFEPFIGIHGVFLFIRILVHNLIATIVTIYAGFFFALIPLFSILTNGLLFGGFLKSVPANTQLSTFETILMILPHGIFEIPSMILSLAIGIKFGSWPFKKDKLKFIKMNFRESSLSLGIIVAPFLFVAAIIETIGMEISYLMK